MEDDLTILHMLISIFLVVIVTGENKVNPAFLFDGFGMDLDRLCLEFDNNINKFR